MTLAQGLVFGIVAAMMALFVWGRIRYDVVAMLALVVSVFCGIVAPKDAFSGFSDDVVIIVASALLVSAAVAKSGITEVVIRPLVPLPWLMMARLESSPLALLMVILPLPRPMAR